jgi:uncharacterized membrane protein YvbJ
MAYCANCGYPLTRGRHFCGNCGRPVDEVSAAAPTQAIKWLWISLAGLVVAAAIACVLVFAVFKGGDEAAATPEETVRRLLSVMENKDADALFALFDPVAVEDALGGADLEIVKELLVETWAESAFDYKSIEFSDIKTTTEKTSDTTATVTIVEGTVTVTNTEGSTATEDVQDSGQPVRFAVIERDGSWYVDPSMFE